MSFKYEIPFTVEYPFSRSHGFFSGPMENTVAKVVEIMPKFGIPDPIVYDFWLCLAWQPLSLALWHFWHSWTEELAMKVFSLTVTVGVTVPLPLRTTLSPAFFVSLKTFASTTRSSVKPLTLANKPKSHEWDAACLVTMEQPVPDSVT